MTKCFLYDLEWIYTKTLRFYFGLPHIGILAVYLSGCVLSHDRCVLEDRSEILLHYISIPPVRYGIHGSGITIDSIVKMFRVGIQAWRVFLRWRNDSKSSVIDSIYAYHMGIFCAKPLFWFNFDGAFEDTHDFRDDIHLRNVSSLKCLS